MRWGAGNVEETIQWNLSLKGLLIKGHLSNQDAACQCPSYIEKCTNKDTPLIRTLHVVPRVSVIERFHHLIFLCRETLITVN